ncbi:MFS transporter [Actinokineospora auranticolor]|uniref:EmrB/QacA subfamily drug resistance transporter n=1 Tax=Actinokineospora auranticolor TaxID=155976 RepID=A0A2S6GLV9_9PSEU|nr:MFS transporter [Actinokineospora auranticolor]PPK66170.1 EmrB/QacA subfamily drug resistance transporter [Actinokineospora auranticolor]
MTVERTGTAAGTPDRSAERGGSVALLLIVACQLSVVLDTGAVNVALPTIRDALGFTTTTAAWVINAELIGLGGLMLVGGRAGDLFGRRAVFRAGAGLFALGALLGGLAPTAWWLVAARAVQGVGAALATPSGLALLVTAFPGRARPRALGVYASVSGIGGAVGLIAGGLLTTIGAWRWTLLLTVPIGLAVVVLAPRFLPAPAKRRVRLDLTGALLSSLGMVALTYGLIRAAAAGWGDAQTVMAFAAAVALLAVFPFAQARAADPLLPPRLLADRTRAGAYAVLLLLAATVLSQFFFLVQFLRDLRGLSPLATGAAFLPMSLSTFLCARAAGALARRWDLRHLMITGAGATAAAMLWLTGVDTGTGYLTGLLGPLVLFGVGLGVLLVAATAAGVSGVAPEHSGTASSLVHVSQRLGGGVGLALLVTVFGTAVRAAGAEGADRAAALARGYSAAFTAGLVFTALALLIAVFVVRPLPPA